MVQILDASVAVKWFVEEEDSKKAQEILSQVLTHPEDFAVPELFLFEIANVLYILSKGDTDLYKDLFDTLCSLPIARYPITAEFHSEIIIFQKLGLTAYDASYAALALLCKGTWLTADKKAVSLLLSKESYNDLVVQF